MKYNVDDNLCDVKLNINKRLKCIKITVANNVITIKSPKKLKESYMLSLLNDNYEFLQKYIDFKTPKVDENRTFIFGNSYGVKKHLTKTNKVYIDDQYLVIETRNLDDVYVKKLVVKFLKETLEPLLNECMILAKESFKNDVDVNINHVIKNVKSYYGKCRPYEREMSFSYLLAKLPIEFIRYVVFHEFAHLKHLNHSKDFYKYLESKLPGAKETDKKLRKIKIFDAF